MPEKVATSVPSLLTEKAATAPTLSHAGSALVLNAVAPQAKVPPVQSLGGGLVRSGSLPGQAPLSGRLGSVRVPSGGTQTVRITTTRLSSASVQSSSRPSPAPAPLRSTSQTNAIAAGPAMQLVASGSPGIGGWLSARSPGNLT